MVTRRSTHANHAKPSSASKRLENRRKASGGGSAYVGGKSGARGGHVHNVAGFGGSAPSGSKSSHRQASVTRGTSRPTPRGSSNNEGVHVPLPNGDEVLLTRRHFLYGALGLGALAAVGAGGSVVVQQAQHSPDDDLVVLEVPASAVLENSELTEVENAEERMKLIGSFELPFGSLVWANDDQVAACLLPTEGASPLTKVALLSLDSGNQTVVLEQAVGNDEGFEIYDVRATSSGLVWTEADILDGIWRVYTATLSGENLGEPTLVEEGDAEWETPSIAVAGPYAFWQVLPKLDGSKSTEDSLFKRATMGSSDSQVLYTSHGRLATPPYALEDSVVITPRTDTSSIHYQLTRIDAASGEVLDTMVLPGSMRPMEAGYGKTGFTFSFNAGYDYGDGIANMGTYAPTSEVTDGNYSGSSWFHYFRDPTAAPVWCGRFLMVKSNKSVVGIDLDAKELFILEVDNGTESYGEYPASTGTRDVLVTFTNVDDKPLDGEAKKYCHVKLWSPLS